MNRAGRNLLIVAVPLAALAAFGGGYSSSVLPLLLAASAAFLLASPPVLTARWRVQDAALLAFLAVLALQLLPLPPGLIDGASPRTRVLANLLAVLPMTGSLPMSLQPVLTRETLISAATVVLTYWTARGMLHHGGSRSVTRWLAGTGLVVAFVGLAQRATAARSLLWLWTPLDPGARPMGPFVNRNHFAMWLVMASAMAIGALATHAAHRGQRRDQFSARPPVVVWLEDSTMLWLAGVAALIWLTVIASGSRGGMVGLVVFAATWPLLVGSRARARHTGLYAALGLLAVAAVGVWANVSVVADRIGSTGDGGIQRLDIWRNTAPVIRDFWLTGTGGGTYAGAMTLYQRSARYILFNEAHSEYLQLVTEGGLLLTVPVAIAVAAWGRSAWTSLRDDRTSLFWTRAAAIGGLLAVASQCVWDSALRMPANALLAAVLAAVAVHEKPLVTDGGTTGRAARKADA